MKKILLPLFALVSFLMGACSTNTITPSKEMTESTLSPAPFTKIDISAPVTVYYTPGAETEVKVSCASNLADMLSVSTVKGELEVCLKNKVNVSRHFAEIYVTAPSVNDFETAAAGKLVCTDTLRLSSIDLEATSASTMEFTAIVVNKAEIDCTSAGTITVNNLQAQSVEVEASSAARINLSGTATSVDIEASSAAAVAASGLTAKNGNVEASSAAMVECNIENARISQSSAAHVNNAR